MNVTFFCADDTHGTPVMLKANEMGITPEELIKMFMRIINQHTNFMILNLQTFTVHIVTKIKNFQNLFITKLSQIILYQKQQ